jgi:DNA polymerase lambda
MVYLVPTRKRRRLSLEVRLGEGTYGSRKLWESVRSACGCVVKNSKTCKECKRIFEWVSKYVPREALRIRNNVLQIKGKSTCRMVYINDERVEVNGDPNSWIGSIPLKVGNTVSLRLKDDPMDFEVIAGKQDEGDSEVATQGEVKSSDDGPKDRCIDSKKGDKDNDAGRASRDGGEQDEGTEITADTAPQILMPISPLSISSSSQKDAAEQDEGTQATADATLQLTPGFSQPVSSNTNTPELMVRLERRIERDSLVWDARRALESQTTQAEKDRTESSPVPEKEKNTAVATLNCSEDTVATSNRSAVQQLKVVDPLNDSGCLARTVNKTFQAIEGTNPIIMFVELGRGLTKGQIRFLTNVVKKKGATVVQTLDSKPTYLVIDAYVNVETLATHLNLKGSNKVDKLKRIISEQNVTPVKPVWITNNKGPKLKAPKLVELYNGLIMDNQSKRKRSPQRVARRPPLSAQSDCEGDDLVAEVPANGGNIVRNVEIAEAFRKLAKMYQKAVIETHDEFRAYTFNLVAGRLNLLNFDIVSDPTAIAKLSQIRGFGGSSLKIINEWLKTRKIERIHSLETEGRRVVTRNMIKIWGVGPKMAQHLYALGVHNIEEVREGLRQNKLDLNVNQRVGVECYEDFQLQMKRNEVEQIRDIVQKELHDMLPNATLTVMGSYRRGKPECGDADLLIFDPGYVNCTPRLALGELVRKLTDKGHIFFHLTQITGLEEVPSDSQSSVGSQGKTYEPYPSTQSYMGVFNSPTIPEVRRRVDIKFYPYRERAFASIYFTGCGWFNRSMRLWATRKKNMHLNDHGLFLDDGKLHHVPRPDEKLLYEFSSEAQVFDILGLVYKQPHERNCFDDVVSTEGMTVASLNIDDKTAWQAEQRHRRNSDAYVDLDD